MTNEERQYRIKLESCLVIFTARKLKEKGGIDFEGRGNEIQIH
jgi:hypothetical protein